MIAEVKDEWFDSIHEFHKPDRPDVHKNITDVNQEIMKYAKDGWEVKQVISVKVEEKPFPFSDWQDVYTTTTYKILFEREIKEE